MPKRAVRIHAELDQRMQKAAKDRGYRTPSAFIRAAIESEVKTRDEVGGLEQQTAASVDRLAEELRRVVRTQHALFALIESFAKAFLLCTAEPAAETRSARLASAKDRYASLMKAAGHSMAKSNGSAWQEMLTRGEE